MSQKRTILVATNAPIEIAPILSPRWRSLRFRSMSQWVSALIIGDIAQNPELGVKVMRETGYLREAILDEFIPEWKERVLAEREEQRRTDYLAFFGRPMPADFDAYYRPTHHAGEH